MFISFALHAIFQYLVALSEPHNTFASSTLTSANNQNSESLVCSFVVRCNGDRPRFLPSRVISTIVKMLASD